MMGDCQVRFCERLGVKLPRSTRPKVTLEVGVDYAIDMAKEVIEVYITELRETGKEVPDDSLTLEFSWSISVQRNVRSHHFHFTQEKKKIVVVQEILAWFSKQKKTERLLIDIITS